MHWPRQVYVSCVIKSRQSYCNIAVCEHDTDNEVAHVSADRLSFGH